MIPDKHICFRPCFGFCVWGEDQNDLTYTQDPDAATEASSDDWDMVMKSCGIDAHTLLPARAYVYGLRQLVTNNAVVLDDAYLDDAMHYLLRQADHAQHYPWQARERIKHVCNAILARQPYDIERQINES